MNKKMYFKMYNDVRNTISENERINFDIRFASQEKKPSTALILSLFFGAMGIDRFYIGKTGCGIIKLFTLGLCGLWVILDWFTIMSVTRRENIKVARALAGL